MFRGELPTKKKKGISRSPFLRQIRKEALKKSGSPKRKKAHDRY